MGKKDDKSPRDVTDDIPSSGSENSVGEDMASPNSKVAWEAILSKEELDVMPARTDSAYLPFRGKIISELNQRLAQERHSQHIDKAENEISALMTQLHIGLRT